MTETLRELIEKARKVRMSADEQEQQRRSFAYGNTHFENSLITKETIRAQAEQLGKKSA